MSYGGRWNVGGPKPSTCSLYSESDGASNAKFFFTQLRAVIYTRKKAVKEFSSWYSCTSLCNLSVIVRHYHLPRAKPPVSQHK